MTKLPKKSISAAMKAHFQMLSEMGRLAIKQKKSQGESMNLAPLGFKKVKQDGRSVLVRDPATWYLVEEAHLLRGKGYTLREICWVLERKGLRSKNGKIITPAGMDKILKRDCPSSVPGTNPDSAA